MDVVKDRVKAEDVQHEVRNRLVGIRASMAMMEKGITMLSEEMQRLEHWIWHQCSDSSSCPTCGRLRENAP